MCNLVEQELKCELCQHLLELEQKTDAILGFMIAIIFGCVVYALLWICGEFIQKKQEKDEVNNNEK